MPHEAHRTRSGAAGNCCYDLARGRLGCRARPEIEMHEATDLEILDYAARESRVVITLDRDFPQILTLTSAARPSVVLLRQQRLRAAEVAALIKSIWREYENALDQGSVVKVSARGTRARLLAFK